MDLSRRARPSPDVLLQVLDDESVLLDLRSETYFGLNAAGTKIWQQFVAGESLEAALDSLVQEYDASPTEIRQDFERLVDELLGKGLIGLE